ncbi:MAG: hypothetical protein AABY45_10640 [Deltaproteobacteria bacterium]
MIKHNNIAFFLLLMLAVALFSCGNDKYDSSASNTNTGSIAFSINMAPTGASASSATNKSISSRAIDCAATGTSTVEAKVYSGSTLIASGGPWACSAHSGTISGVAPGIGHKVTISAKDSMGTTIYYGEITGVNVTSGQTANAGVITLSAAQMGGAIQVGPLNLTTVVTTLAGTAGSLGSADGTGSVARFYNPYGITTDGTNLYVADSDNHTVRKIVISTGVVTTLAGTAGSLGSADGTGSVARFNYPYGITTDGTNLYVADTFNHTVRKIVISTGVVTTPVGTAGSLGSSDGTGSVARFSYPYGITTDGTNLYVADFSNHTVRKIVISTGVVTTPAGTALSFGATDGTGPVARFYNPIGITTDGTNLYVADYSNHTVRKIQ